MSLLATAHTGLSAIIENLTKEKEALTIVYAAAIANGCLQEIKTIYLELKDVNKRLNDLLRVRILIQ